MTVSLWQRGTSSEPVRAECIVIGAGICGISAALHLQRRQIDTIVLERGRVGGVGSGASARNAGFLMRGAAENYALSISAYGRELTRLIWRWTEENLAGLRAEGIDDVHGFALRPSCLLALQKPEHTELRRSVTFMREDGFAVEWIDSGDDAAWRNLRPLGGLLNPGDAVCHPVHLLRFLAGRLRRPVQEECEVVRISGGRSSLVQVETSRGIFAAPRVLVCTNAYIPLLLPQFEGVITPRRGQVLAVRSPEQRLNHAYYANHGYEYFRQVDDQTMLFGGCRRAFADTEIGYEDRFCPGVQGSIEAFAARTLGIAAAKLEVTARWTGTMGFSPDGLPLAGPVDGDWTGGAVHFCGGFTGHGMSLGYRVARSAVDCMLDGVPSPLALARVKLPLRLDSHA
jgi:gamma-glutamylputrescine oxidase